MSSRCTSSIPKEDVVFPRIIDCDSRCSKTLPGLSPALPGALLCNATRRLGDLKCVILCQRVQGSVRAVRAIRNTPVCQMKTRVVADDGSIIRGQNRLKQLRDGPLHWETEVAEYLDISNSCSLSQKHPGVPNGYDSSEGISYHLTDNYMHPVALHCILPGSTGDMSGSTSNHSRAVWEKQHLLWEYCWCSWNS
jgi:hypothetical protein